MSIEKIHYEQPSGKLRPVDELKAGDIVLANGEPVEIQRIIDLPTGEIRLELQGKGFMQVDHRTDEIEVPVN
jgi:hypothetical protein